MMKFLPWFVISTTILKLQSWFLFYVNRISLFSSVIALQKVEIWKKNKEKSNMDPDGEEKYE